MNTYNFPIFKIRKRKTVYLSLTGFQFPDFLSFITDESSFPRSWLNSAILFLSKLQILLFLRGAIFCCSWLISAILWQRWIWPNSRFYSFYGWAIFSRSWLNTAILLQRWICPNFRFYFFLRVIIFSRSWLNSATLLQCWVCPNFRFCCFYGW